MRNCNTCTCGKGVLRGPVSGCYVMTVAIYGNTLLSVQEEYYLTHQCFLTNRALNIIVWNATEEERGIEGLSIWLQNLHVRVDDSLRDLVK